MGYEKYCADNEYLTHAKTLAKHPDYNLIAAVDNDSEKRKYFRDKYEIDVFSDVKTIPKEIRESIEVLVVATPTSSHYIIVKSSFELLHNIKVLMCEKPLSTDYEEAEKILLLSKEKNIKLFVNYMRRSEKGCNTIKEMIDSGRFESPIKCVCWYTNGIYNNSSHFLNILKYWLGDCISSKIIDNTFENKLKDPLPSYYAKFERGNVIFVSAWHESFAHCTIELLSKSGRIYYSDFGLNILLYEPDIEGNTEIEISLKKEPIEIKNNMDRYQYEVYDEISNYIQSNDASKLSTGEDALDTIKWINNLFK